MSDPTKGGKYCGAKTRAEGSHEHCRKPAGWGTDHNGSGRCKLHGGATPVSNGRYSKLTRHRLRDLAAEFEQDADPLDLFPELAMARAMFVDFIDRYQAFRDALIAWHEARRKGESAPRPLHILDIADARRLLEEIGKFAERIEKMRMMDAISKLELLRITREIGRVVRENNGIADPAERLRLIERGWSTIPTQIH